MTILSASKLSFSYKAGRSVLTDLDFQAASGRILGISGANGSGKSTLINILAGIFSPTSGELRLGDLGPAETLARLRRSSSTLPQNINHWLLGETGAEDLLLGLDEKDPQVKTRVDDLTGRWGLADFLNQPVETLSLGQKKRLALAAALARNPEALFLDEPASGLDWPGTVAMMEDLAGLKKSGLIIVLITHEPDLLSPLVDDWLLLKKGGEYFFGSPGPAEMEKYQIRPF